MYSSFICQFFCLGTESRSLSVSLSAGLIQAKCFCFYAYKINLFVIPSADWRRIRHVPTTLCGHYFSKHPAVLIMSIPFLPPVPPTPVSSLSGFCLPHSAEGEASILMAPNWAQTSKAAALFMSAIAEQPDFIRSISEGSSLSKQKV